jgi:hypothetical protein
MLSKFDVQSALYHFDEVLALRPGMENGYQVGQNGERLSVSQLNQLYAAYRFALDRYCPPGSVYSRLVAEATEGVSISNEAGLDYTIAQLDGILRSLQREWCGDRLRTLAELVHASMFADMLEAALHLLGEGYHGPAAVMAGAVLEQHIRKLCEKNAIPTTTTKNGNAIPKKLDAMNTELAGNYAGGKQDQKEVTTLAGLRNHAAHGEFDKFDDRQVDLMIQSIRGFINRNPA